MNPPAPTAGPDRHTPVKLRLKRTRRFKAGLAVVLFGVAIAVVHTLEHAGAFTVYRPSFDDILLGWPMAGVLVIVGFVIMGS